LEEPIVDDCVSTVVGDIDIDRRWRIWCSRCCWEKEVQGLTRKAESSGCYVVVVVVDGGRRAMGPGKQVVKEVHEGPAGYKRRTRKGATVKASQ
jgi:hypothetical protein